MIILAYIDPGYGALIWQALVAAALGTIFFFRHTVMGYLRRAFGKKKADPKIPETGDS